MLSAVRAFFCRLITVNPIREYRVKLFVEIKHVDDQPALRNTATAALTAASRRAEVSYPEGPSEHSGASGRAKSIQAQIRTVAGRARSDDGRQVRIVCDSHDTHRGCDCPRAGDRARTGDVPLGKLHVRNQQTRFPFTNLSEQFQQTQLKVPKVACFSPESVPELVPTPHFPAVIAFASLWLEIS